MSRILVIGASGLLGAEFLREGLRRGYRIVGTYRSYPFATPGVDTVFMDLSSEKSILSTLEVVKPSKILISGAMRDVDLCEREREEAWKVNVTSAEIISHWASENDARVYYVSTDYVFDGKGIPEGGYREDSPTSPVNYYGMTKREGEKRVLDMGGGVFRVALLFGMPRVEKTNNFALWVLDSISRGLKVHLYSNIITSPTYAPWAAAAMLDIMEMDYGGIFHITPDIGISRLDFGRRIAMEFISQSGRSSNVDDLVEETTFKPDGSRAPRPEKTFLRPSPEIAMTPTGHMPPLDVCIKHMVRGYMRYFYGRN